MAKKNIYVVQFETGTNINLLPLAAGQLVAKLKEEKELFEKWVFTPKTIRMKYQNSFK